MIGRITTPHGVIETPAFVPGGTNAALKCLDEGHSREAGVQLMFCNTYHLLVHPGPEVVRGAGGRHSWMGHEGALITDSGGFQVFSLAHADAEDGPELKRRSATRGRNEGTLLRVNERGHRLRVAAAPRTRIDAVCRARSGKEATPEERELCAMTHDFSADLGLALGGPLGLSSRRWGAVTIQACSGLASEAPKPWCRSSSFTSHAIWYLRGRVHDRRHEP